MSTHDVSQDELKKMAELHGMSVEEFQKAAENMHSSKPFVLIENYYPKSGEEEAVLAIADESVEFLTDVEGVILVQCLKPRNESDPISKMSIWTSEKALQTFMRSDAVKAHFSPEKMALVKEKIEKTDVQKYDYHSGWHGLHH